MQYLCTRFQCVNVCTILNLIILTIYVHMLNRCNIYVPIIYIYKVYAIFMYRVSKCKCMYNTYYTNLCYLYTYAKCMCKMYVHHLSY